MSGQDRDVSKTSLYEKKNRLEIIELFRDCPIPSDELLDNLGLFQTRQNLSRILFFEELYRQIININGIIIEFGVRWGQNLAVLQNLRGALEPFNHTRKIVGFDTFSGFPSVNEKDGRSKLAKIGKYSVSKDYAVFLEKLLQCHENESPISHLKKFELVVGDASKTFPSYLANHPETIVALAYFDFDIYEPTKACLEAILPHMGKGSILAFDELNFAEFPGESLAFQEVLGVRNHRIVRSPLVPLPSYVVFE